MDVRHASRRLATATVLPKQLLSGHRLLHCAKATTRIANLRYASTTAAATARNPHTRLHSSREAYYAQRNRSLLFYSAATLILGIGVTYAAVPLYRVFCSTTGYGGVPITSGGSASGNTRFAADKLIPFIGDASRKERKIKVTFNADCSDALPWKFTPLQKEVRVRPGESALAFYTAMNKSKKDIIGIATYNVTPNNVSPPMLTQQAQMALCACAHASYLRSAGGPILCQSRMFLF